MRSYRQLTHEQRYQIEALSGTGRTQTQIWDIAVKMREADKKGWEKGREEGRLDVTRNLLRMGLPLEKIMEATGLTREEIQSLQPH